MANLVITYWRDIPSAVSVKIGRKEEKRMLDNRFMEAIDMAAMRDGATNTDDYLADWRRGEPLPVSDDMAAEADKAKAESLRLLRAPDARAALSAAPEAVAQLRPLLKAIGLAA